MNTTLHLIFSYADHQRKATTRATVINRFHAFFNSFLGLFAPADDPAALRYMSGKSNDGID
jgi:hypothetical protein